MPSTSTPAALSMDQIEKLVQSQPEKAVIELQKALKASETSTTNGTEISEHDAKVRETATLRLGVCFQKLKRAEDLASLIRNSHAVLANLPKAKTAKIVRTLLDNFSSIPDSQSLQISVCKDLIEWSISTKRIFLRQSLETRLVALYIDNKSYTDALALIGTLLRELKRLDDKAVLMEVQLLESRVYHLLRNLPKSRAALTSARTSANSIYCPPLMQAALDMQSGILHAEEKDYKTAFSYFFETMEGYNTLEDNRAVIALKYMLLCKIMVGEADDVPTILQSKTALKYQSRDLEAMKAVALAYKNRNLTEFEDALKVYKDELSLDPIIRNHLSTLYDNLLEANLLRVIEPFSRVEITHVASLVKLPVPQVEAKLSQMILDKVFNGILDQGSGDLILFEEGAKDVTYDVALDTIKTMGQVVESLYVKAGGLS